MSRLSIVLVTKIAFVGLVIVFATGLTGCKNFLTETDSKKDALTEIQHVAIIISNTQNEGLVDTSLFLDDITNLSLAEGSTVSLFNCDGVPEYIDTLTIPEYKSGISEQKKMQLAEKYSSQIIDLMSGLVPNDEELDLYKAMDMAARRLSGYDQGAKTLYIASSGLSTAGLVNFADLYVEDDRSEELIEALKDEMPDLSGIKVVWFGIGETAGKQTDLYESNRKVLKSTWTSLLVSAGVNEDNIDFSSVLSVNTGNKPNDLPNVSVVPISQPGTIMTDYDFELADASENDNEGKLLDLRESVAFKPDSTELINAKDAKKSLSKIIDYLKDDASREILLVGTTSSAGEKKSLQKFSLKRCQTIKDLFVKQGIKSSQIICCGAGYGSSLTVKDRDASGNLIKEKAEKNRSVHLYTNAESHAAQKILCQYKSQ